jgi:hypothetical protein
MFRRQSVANLGHCAWVSDYEAPRSLSPDPWVPLRHCTRSAYGAACGLLHSPNDLGTRCSSRGPDQEADPVRCDGYSMHSPTGQGTGVSDRALAESGSRGYFQKLVPAVHGAHDVTPLGSCRWVRVGVHGRSMAHPRNSQVPETARTGAQFFVLHQGHSRRSACRG